MARQNKYSVLLSADVSEFSKNFDAARRQSASTFDQMEKDARNVSFAFGAVAAGGIGLGKAILSSTSLMQDLTQGFVAVTGSSDTAAQKMEFLYDFVKTTKFELKEVAEAGLKLEAFGFNAEQTLPTIAKLAAVMNKDLVDAAAIVGKAMLGSRRSVTQLKDSYGITNTELIRFGANIDSQGLVAVKGSQNIEKLKNAILTLIETKYGKIFEAQAKNLSVAAGNMADSFRQLGADVGQTVSPEIIEFMNWISKGADELRKADPAVKKHAVATLLIGTATAAAIAGISGMVAIVTKLGAALAPVGPWITGLEASLTGAAGSAGEMAATLWKSVAAGEEAGLTFARLGGAGAKALEMLSNWEPVLAELGSVPSVAAEGAAALAEVGAAGTAALGAALGPLAGLVVYMQYLRGTAYDVLNPIAIFNGLLDQANKLYEELIEKRERWANGGSTNADIAHMNGVLILEKQRQVALEKNRDLASLSSQEILASGRGQAEVKRNILALESQVQNAEKNGYASTAQNLRNEINILKSKLPLLKQVQDAQAVAQGQATQQAVKDTQGVLAAYEDFVDKKKERIFESKEDELAAMDQWVAWAQKTADLIVNIDKKKYDEIHQHIVEFEKDRVRLARDVRKEQADEAIQEVKREAQAHKISKLEESAQLRKLADQYKDVRGVYTKLTGEAAAMEREHWKDIANAKNEAMKIEEKLIDLKSQSVEADIKKGEKVEENIKKAIELVKEKQKVEEAVAANERDKDLTQAASEEEEATVRKKYEYEIAQIRQEANNKIKSLGEQAITQKKNELKVQEELRSAVRATADARVQELESSLDRGEKVGDSLIKEIKLRQTLDAQLRETARQVALLEAPRDKRKDVNKKFAEDEKKIAIENREQIRKAQERIDQKNIEGKSKELDLQKKQAELRKKDIEEQKRTGVDVRAAEVALVEEQLNVETESLKIKAASEALGKSKSQQVQIEKNLELDIALLRKNAKKDIDDINASYKKGSDELTKQKDELKAINDELAKLKGEQAKDQKEKGGLIGGVEDLANQMKREQDIFDLESRKRRKEQEIGDAEKRDKSISLNQLEGERHGILFNGRNTAEAARDVELRAIEESRRQKRDAEREKIREEGRAQAEKRLRDQGKTPEEIEKILGINFKRGSSILEKGLPTPPDGYTDSQKTGSQDESVKYLAKIVEIISQAIGRNAAPKGAKPENQLGRKGKASVGPLSNSGSLDGPYPV